ncbi:MAG: hypothetical protein OER21_00060 [Gemmatimonadota bacterium]|nr:hypothetical protein [Gemmatimonadota bacterium]
MRVDTVPLPLRPLLAVYGYGLAGVFALYYLAQRPTIRVVVSGAPRLESRNYIFCLWHEAISLLFQSSVPRFPRPLRAAPQAWMQHPLWYMKPIHAFIRGIGVRKIVLGSTGHGGRPAADALVVLLRAGYSTVVLPDGPAGPARELKKGVLHLAAQSGVPIVPLRLFASRSYRARTWDRKIQALPFATLRIAIGEPLSVADDTLAPAARTLTAALG